MLVVRDLVKDYPAAGGRTSAFDELSRGARSVEPLRVLAGVSFKLAAGESLAVMGPSGSGKSTLLNILGTLDSPTEGEVIFEGENVHEFSAARAAEFRNRRIGFVFQDHHLLPQCTALENVLLPCLAFGGAAPEAVERARGLLDMVGLEGRADHFPAELSGGERQRVAIARAMVMTPRLLLCDEPTGNIDAETGEAVARLFLELRDEREVAVIVVTHNGAVAGMFGRTRTLREGRLHE